MVLSLWPSAAVRIFGSCITGLALPSSDIDLVIQLFRQQHYMPYQFQTQGQYQQGPVTQSPSRYQDPRISLKGQGQKHPQQEMISPSSPLVQSSWQNDVDSSPLLEKDRTGEDSPRGRRKGKSFVFPPSPPGEVDSSDPSNHSPPLVLDVGDGSQSSFEFQQQYYPNSNPYARKQPQVSISSPSRQPDTFLSQQMQELGMIPPPGPLPPSPEMFNSLFFALTSQLYMQIWASQVNPIPSATVPVIKMQVAADTLLANPAMQQAVYAVHRQQLHSPIVEPAVFMQHFVPPSLGPNANPNPTRNDTYPGTPQSYFVPPFPSLSLDAAGSVSRTGQNNAQTRDPGSSSRDATPSHSRHSTIDMTNDKQESVHPHPALSAAVESSAEGIYTQTQAHRGHHAQQQQQQQQQHQQHFSYPSTPFISSPGRIGERGHYMPPPHGTQPFMPPAPFAFLPFHMAAGVNIAVDITIEAGQHKVLVLTVYLSLQSLCLCSDEAYFKVSDS